METTVVLLQNSLLPMLGLLASSGVALLLVLVFRPLLVGVLRAALLVVRPRLSREDREARNHMRDRRVLDQLIASSNGPSDAAELRAIASRA